MRKNLLSQACNQICSIQCQTNINNGCGNDLINKKGVVLCILIFQISLF